MARSSSVADLSLIFVSLNILLSRSRSFKMVPFESLGTVSYLHSVVTMALSVSFPRYCEILVENHDSFLPPCIRSSVRGGHCRSIAIPFVTEKTRMVWLCDYETSLMTCLVVLIEYRRVTDRQTDRHLATA